MSACRSSLVFGFISIRMFVCQSPGDLSSGEPLQAVC